jgi:glycosyltransferase involved in cell wall biosynthesis
VITFAVIGHNEAATLRRALGQALEAAGSGDEVVFVDSASRDRSADVAEGCGVRRIDAPLGKGRAMQEALAACTTRYIAFVDADIHGSARNIPGTLAEAVRGAPATMVVGQFGDASDGVLSNTIAVYTPLVARFFPEAADRYGSRPLTGFRTLDATLDWGVLPPGFGVEAHLNVAAALMPDAVLRVHDIGDYEGRFLYKPTMGLEIAEPVLDWAQRLGRLRPGERPGWERWVQERVDYIATYRGDRDSRERFRAGLHELAAGPFPA